MNKTEYILQKKLELEILEGLKDKFLKSATGDINLLLSKTYFHVVKQVCDAIWSNKKVF